MEQNFWVLQKVIDYVNTWLSLKEFMPANLILSCSWVLL